MKLLEYTQKTFVSTGFASSVFMCLISVINYYKAYVDIEYLLSIFNKCEGGISLSNLVKVSGLIGFKAVGMKGTLEELRKMESPTILGVTNDNGKNECVVYYGYLNQCYIIGVPFWGVMQYKEEEMALLWKSRIIITLEPTDSLILKKDLNKKQFKWFLKSFKTERVSIMLYSIFLLLSLFFVGYTIFSLIYSSIVYTVVSLGLLLTCFFLYYTIKLYTINIFKIKIKEILKNIDITDSSFDNYTARYIMILDSVKYFLLFFISGVIFINFDFIFSLILLVIGILIMYMAFKFCNRQLNTNDFEQHKLNLTVKSHFSSFEINKVKLVAFILTIIYLFSIVIIYSFFVNQFLYIFTWALWTYSLLKLIILMTSVIAFYSDIQKLHFRDLKNKDILKFS